ncbi:MAG TPA: hypothetical protein PLC54_08875, partial [Spirochaetales bacterium]|nr:hypothetical protein [Spirochaetales bacterium]
MNCERFLNYVDSLEPAETSMPAAMAEHAAACPSCADALATMRRSMALLRTPSTFARADIVSRVGALLPFVQAPRRTVAMRNWVLVGLLIMLGMVFLPLLSDFDALTAVYGSSFTLPVALVLGLVLSVYAVAFVFSNA